MKKLASAVIILYFCEWFCGETGNENLLCVDTTRANHAQKVIKQIFKIIFIFRKSMYRLNRLFNYVISRKKSHHVEDIVDGIIHRDRGKLAEGITLVESSHPKKKILAQELLTKILNLSRKNKNQLSYRIGISGAPGAGKSSFIEALGTMLTDERYRVAVLAVDPSSVNTGGSLLGDKTRMTELSRRANAYIRPSPSSGALG